MLLFGRRRIALHYNEGGIWRGVVEHYTDRTPVVYRYAVERDGACTRTEWRPHAPPARGDPGPDRPHPGPRWQEMPADASFYSSAFTRGIFTRPEAEKKSGPHRAKSGQALLLNATLRLTVPALYPDETLALASDSLDAWQRIVPLDDSRFPEWNLSFRLPEGSEYKLLIAYRATLEPILWEEGPTASGTARPPRRSTSSRRPSSSPASPSGAGGAPERPCRSSRSARARASASVSLRT